jgi:signal transduction histidine kinase
MAAVTLATLGGLVAVVLAPRGLAEVPVFLAASRIAVPISSGWGRIFVIVDMVAVATVIGLVSRSLLGALAGLGIPVLAQRAVERRELIASRDEAQALLVEVQAGREAESEAAALQERSRIARDLHDVLAHSLAGLSVQLQATRAIAARENVDPAVLEPLDKAATLARDGLAEARAVVSALHDPVGLGVDEVPALIERHPGEVALSVTGAPRPVAPEPGHAVYRAVQEALTNAARYAPGAAVTVTLAYASNKLRVCVADTGLSPGRNAVPSQGSGLGLAGMAERLRAVGGSVTAGPRPGGGWQVEMGISTDGTT